jgi:type IV secretion system protein TrbL
VPTALASQFNTAVAAMYGALLPIAQNLFIFLAAIHITWALIWWVIEKDDPVPLFVSLLRNLMRISFFWFVLINADTLSQAVLTSFRMAGQAAANAAGAPVPSLDPSAVIGTGATLAGQIANNLQLSGLLSSLWGGLAGLLVSVLMFVAFLFIAAQMVIALIEGFILMGAGVLLLGFLGSPWTARFGLTYFSAIVGTGIKLFMIYVIVGFGGALVSGWTAQIAAGVTFVQALTIVGVALLFALVTWWIPNYAQALTSGAVTTTLQTAISSIAGIGAMAAGARIPLTLGARASAALGQGVALARDRYRAGAGTARAIGAGVEHTVLSPFRAGAHNLATRNPYHRMTAADALRRKRGL